MNKPTEDIRSILATDCGSTTTKAILIEKRGAEYQLIVRGEAPTTVEAPVEDVTAGVINAITEVEELAGRKLLKEGVILKPQRGDEGVDLYISTSSAGGGLQMMVAGVVRNLTAESAERAALGAGAIVMDVIASNDKRLPHEKLNGSGTSGPTCSSFPGGSMVGRPRTSWNWLKLSPLPVRGLDSVSPTNSPSSMLGTQMPANRSKNACKT